MSIPTTLTLEDAEALTELLQKAREQLRDAADGRFLADRYGDTVTRIGDTLRSFGVEPN